MGLPQLIGLKPTSPLSYEIYFKTKLLGNATKDVDGFYYFWPYGTGCWNDYSLRLIADTIEFLNEPLETRLKQAFENDY